MINDDNCQKEDWELFFEFSMVAAQMDPNDKKISILNRNVDPVTATNPKNRKWSDHRLDSTLGTKPAQSPATNRGSTDYMDQSFWKKLTNMVGSDIGDMIQAQQIMNWRYSAPSVHV